jgi:hypothetical protein
MVSHVGEGQPIADETVGQGVSLCHIPNVPHRARSQTRQQPFTATSPSMIHPDGRASRNGPSRPSRPRPA